MSTFEQPSHNNQESDIESQEQVHSQASLIIECVQLITMSWGMHPDLKKQVVALIRENLPEIPEQKGDMDVYPLSDKSHLTFDWDDGRVYAGNSQGPGCSLSDLYELYKEQE